MKYLRSRTVQTILFAFVVAGFEGITGLVPDAYLDPILGILGVMAMYFRVTPRQVF